MSDQLFYAPNRYDCVATAAAAEHLTSIRKGRRPLPFPKAERSPAVDVTNLT